MSVPTSYMSMNVQATLAIQMQFLTIEDLICVHVILAILAMDLIVLVCN